MNMKIKISDALIIFLTMIFLACKIDKEEGLYKTAVEDLKNSNTESAIKNLEKLVEQNPYSEYAPDAFFTLASIYQSLEGDSLRKEEYYKKAFQYYNEIIEKFPNHEKTPEAIFMAGFISAEYLKNYDQARHFYKKFLKAYPEHELATSVQAELENLGKTPEEILKSKGIEIQSHGMNK